MDREIKFRYYDQEFNMMVYDTEDIAIGYSIKTKPHLKFMRYAGIKDKNGKHIYEGDIVNIKNIGITSISYGEIIHEIYLGHGGRKSTEKKAVGFKIDKIVEMFYFDDGLLTNQLLNSYDIKIIGNIYENPELMKNV